MVIKFSFVLLHSKGPASRRLCIQDSHMFGLATLLGLSKFVQWIKQMHFYFCSLMFVLKWTHPSDSLALDLFSLCYLANGDHFLLDSLEPTPTETWCVDHAHSLLIYHLLIGMTDWLFCPVEPFYKAIDETAVTSLKPHLSLLNLNGWQGVYLVVNMHSGLNKLFHALLTLS